MPERKTRLCIVTPAHSSAQTGGAEYQIDCLIEALSASDRFDIHYLARLVRPEFQAQTYRIVRLGRNNRSPRFGYVTDAVPLYQALRAARPDVIYQRVACGYTGIAAYFARRHNVQMLWHVAHDSDVTSKSVIDGRNPIRRHLEKSAIRYGIRHARSIVTQTAHQASLLERNYARRAAAVIPNFQPAPTESLDKSGPVTVAWIGGLKQWKQPEVFVRLANSLRDLDGVRFVVVGAGPRDAWHDALMHSMTGTPNIEYLGGQSQQQVNNLLASAHLYVNTSLYEGFPNTFIQSWMRAVPVISLQVDPDGVLTREQIGIRAGSEAQLAVAVRSLATNASMRAGMAAKARRYALEHHSLANVNLLVALMLEELQ